jgi:hypothetical protein
MLAGSSVTCARVVTTVPKRTVSRTRRILCLLAGAVGRIGKVATGRLLGLEFRVLIRHPMYFSYGISK